MSLFKKVNKYECEVPTDDGYKIITGHIYQLRKNETVNFIKNIKKIPHFKSLNYEKIAVRIDVVSATESVDNMLEVVKVIDNFMNAERIELHADLEDVKELFQKARLILISNVENRWDYFVKRYGVDTKFDNAKDYVDFIIKEKNIAYVFERFYTGMSLSNFNDFMTYYHNERQRLLNDIYRNSGFIDFRFSLVDNLDNKGRYGCHMLILETRKEIKQPKSIVEDWEIQSIKKYEV